MWASNVLSMPHRLNGPDLIDKVKFVEVKSGSSKDSWTLVDEQIDYQKNYDSLIGHILLIVYSPAILVKNLKERDLQNLPSMIKKREAYLLPYSWLERFETREGKHHRYLYPNPSDFPKFDRTYRTNADILHIAKDIPKELFKK